jgi:DNA-directed RNA polymerase specialized sigma24 family protein
MPEGLTEAEKQAWLNALCKKHAKLIEELVKDRHDLGEQSRESLGQRVREIFYQRVEEGAVIDNPRAWLREVIRKDARNHKDLRKPPIDDGADATLVPAPSQDEPEETALYEEQWAAVERYLPQIPVELAEVIRCVHMYAMTIEETAISVDRPVTTVFYEHKRALAMLRELAEASQRATALGAGGALEEN